MSDPLFELLAPHFEQTDPCVKPSAGDATTATYLTHLSSLSLTSLQSTEVQTLSQTLHTNLLSIQSLSSRSHKAIVASSSHLSTLGTYLPTIATEAGKLQHAIPQIEQEALAFSDSYSKKADNTLLERRKRAILLSRNVDRLTDILELPSLLASAIASASGSYAAGQAPSAASYASALDLFGHIKRLQKLYPHSKIIRSVAQQAEEAMRGMTTNLIATLRSPNLKLASAMRTVGLLRRVAPEFGSSKGLQPTTEDGVYGGIFLASRMANLEAMLDALDPLKELADQEQEENKARVKRKDSLQCQQTERYRKRYLEIFREQSFAIISMYRSIFPNEVDDEEEDDLQPAGGLIASFCSELVGRLPTGSDGTVKLWSGGGGGYGLWR